MEITTDWKSSSVLGNKKIIQGFCETPTKGLYLKNIKKETDG
jgi:hypothetical protein